MQQNIASKYSSLILKFLFSFCFWIDVLDEGINLRQPYYAGIEKAKHAVLLSTKICYMYPACKSSYSYFAIAWSISGLGFSHTNNSLKCGLKPNKAYFRTYWFYIDVVFVLYLCCELSRWSHHVLFKFSSSNVDNWLADLVAVANAVDCIDNQSVDVSCLLVKLRQLQLLIVDVVNNLF